EALQGIEVSGLEHAVNLVGDFGKGWKTVRDDAIQALSDIESQLLKLGARKILGKLFKAPANDNAAGLLTAGTTLGTAGATLTTAAGLWQTVVPQLLAAAEALQAAGVANLAGGGGGAGGVGGLGSIFGAILGSGVGGAGAAA